MKWVITEAELDQIDLRQFHEIMAVADATDFSGVGVYFSPRMAPMVAPLTVVPLTITNQLLIVVSDPDDEEIIARLKQKVIARK